MSRYQLSGNHMSIKVDTVTSGIIKHEKHILTVIGEGEGKWEGQESCHLEDVQLELASKESMKRVEFTVFSICWELRKN